MKRFIGFLILFALIFTAAGCGNSWWFCKKKPAEQENVMGVGRKMVAIYNIGITNAQLDSICVADTLSMDFNDWLNTYFIDYETRDTVFKHTFVKSLADKQEAIYIVTEWKDSLAIIKRVTK